MSRNEVRTVRRSELDATELSERIQGLMERVRERAYEIFANRGAQDGHDLDDWFKAEEEILMPFPCEVAADEKAMTVHLKVPGFEAAELTVNVAAGRLVIEGSSKRETKADDSSETEAKTFLEQLAIPENADLDHVTAEFHHHELRIKVPLIAAKKAAQSETAPAAAARVSITAA